MQDAIAKQQYQLSSIDMETILALVRTGTMNAAALRMGIDASTVFRVLQRIEKGVGQTLFERSRNGCRPLEIALHIAHLAEHMEVQMEAARSLLQTQRDQVVGAVRVTTTDTILHGLVAPVLNQFTLMHPSLNFEMHTGNELANLTQRDADIALRATKRPPTHLVGKHIGPIRVALFSAKGGSVRTFDHGQANSLPWIATDDAMPDHPSVVWRRRHFPKVVPRYRVNSILSVAEFVAKDLGIGVLPIFLAAQRSDLQQLTDVIDECQTELWLLTHTESRYLRRISVLFSYLSEHIVLS